VLLALRRADDTSSLVVKHSFSTPALAAVPVSTGAYAAQVLTAANNNNSSSSSSSSGGGSSSTVTARPIVDLLVLQPDGRLLLHRGAAPLVAVQAQLPPGHLHHLQQRLVTAALARQHNQQQQQQQQRKLGSPADGVGGRQGRAESDEEDDMMMAETPTQREWTRLICSA
jgi:hypothetical protein